MKNKYRIIKKGPILQVDVKYWFFPFRWFWLDYAGTFPRAQESIEWHKGIRDIVGEE